MYFLVRREQIQETQVIEGIQLIIRKLAHFSIYAIGGFLIMNYAYSIEKTQKQKILYSIALGGSYAITDELHQFFLSGRSGNVFDVAIDTAGVITGVFIYIVLRKIIKKMINKHKIMTI